VKTEELTISIAQYADGTLPAAERTRVEALLESDAELQGMLGQEQMLTALLRSDPLPQLDWDELAVRFSNAVPVDLTLGRKVPRRDRLVGSSWMRFGPLTIPLNVRSVFAAAASFIIGLGLATYLMRSAPKPIADNTNGATSTIDHNSASVAFVVDGPQEDQPVGRAVEEVSIGPGGSYASASAPSPYSEEISARPARVMIAAEAPAVQASTPTSPF
jgi:anti-sigma factor RsiW